MTVRPSVSCIIPVYNGAAFIAQAIESALNQSHALLEIIVIDDGSTDGTGSVVQSIADPRITYVPQANAGCTAARNHGISLASGDFLALLDADDLWEQDKTDRQLRLFAERPELAAITTLMQNFWSDELIGEADSNPQLAVPQPGVSSTFMCRKASMDQVGPLDPRYPDRDLQEWLLRLKESGRHHALLENVLVHRRLHAHNMSRTRTPGESELLELAAKLLARRRSK